MLISESGLYVESRKTPLDLDLDIYVYKINILLMIYLCKYCDLHAEILEI
jgi:hypothetical protein